MLKIVRQDITQMTTDAIVTMASAKVRVGFGMENTIYRNAGFHRLLNYRKVHIGIKEEGEAFITPGFDLSAPYIIHCVPPRKKDSKMIASCYKNCIELAIKYHLTSIAFPLFGVRHYGNSKEEALRIALDHLGPWIEKQDISVYIVVDDHKNQLLTHLLDKYLETNAQTHSFKFMRHLIEEDNMCEAMAEPLYSEEDQSIIGLEEALKQRMNHLSDGFSDYLLYLIAQKKMKNADVYKRALVDKKVFSKIKNHPEYHPTKRTVLCLCIGAKLNIDDATDLLERAGYALSPSDKTDVIFRYFIEHKIYDMIELDIQLENHGCPCIIE